MGAFQSPQNMHRSLQPDILCRLFLRISTTTFGLTFIGLRLENHHIMDTCLFRKFFSALPSAQNRLSNRWFSTCVKIHCVVMQHEQESHIAWRRLQVHEQQSERQRKNPFQKAQVFHQRAQVLLSQDFDMV